MSFLSILLELSLQRSWMLPEMRPPRLGPHFKHCPTLGLRYRLIPSRTRLYRTIMTMDLRVETGKTMEKAGWEKVHPRRMQREGGAWQGWSCSVEKASERVEVETFFAVYFFFFFFLLLLLFLGFVSFAILFDLSFSTSSPLPHTFLASCPVSKSFLRIQTPIPSLTFTASS